MVSDKPACHSLEGQHLDTLTTSLASQIMFYRFLTKFPAGTQLMTVLIVAVSSSTSPLLLWLFVCLQLSERVLQDQVLGQLFAGHETTAAIMTHMLQRIKANPDVLDCMRQEQDSLIGQHGPQLDGERPYLLCCALLLCLCCVVPCCP